MGFSVKHLKDALERPLPPAPMSGGRPPPRIDRYPLRPLPPLPYLYRVDPLILLLQIAAVAIVAAWAFT